MGAKLGLIDVREGDRELLEATVKILAADRADYTIFWHRLSRHVGGESADLVRDLFLDREGFDRWLTQYEARLGTERPAAARRMRQVNPKYVLRNHLCEIAIRQARLKDFSEVQALLSIVQSPFEEHATHEDKAGFPPDWAQHIEISCSS
jgi:serine/tyrosine/threonine adenylyltransferase